MVFHPLRAALPRRSNFKTRPRRPRLRLAGHKPFVERLEDRNLLSGGAPLPIPGGFANPTGGHFVHLNLPGPVDQPPPNPPTSPFPATNEPSTITDFNGDLAVADVTGTGTDGSGNTLYFAADLRFMDGLYQDVNGNVQHGMFALV